jgi:hypothetical protein
VCENIKIDFCGFCNLPLDTVREFCYTKYPLIWSQRSSTLKTKQRKGTLKRFRKRKRAVGRLEAGGFAEQERKNRRRRGEKTQGRLKTQRDFRDEEKDRKDTLARIKT